MFTFFNLATSVFLAFALLSGAVAQPNSILLESLPLRDSILLELNAAVGGSMHAAVDIGKDLKGIEEVMTPIVNASPKNEYGRLSENEARYALHRYFMQQHSWDIRTFDNDKKADDIDETPCLFNFGRQVPYEAQAVLEKHVVEKGASITILSIFAALLEHLIRDEIPGNLVKEYKAMGLPRTGTLPKEVAEDLMDFHMAIHIKAEDVSEYKPEESREVLRLINLQYANWDRTQAFFRSIQEDALPGKTEYTFEDVLNIVNRLEDKLAQVTDGQCSRMKGKLMDLETTGSGRVPLVDFYDSAINHGNPQFMEPIEYLRQLGALDESDPHQRRLVITNYIDGPSNCVARTPYYSVCCVDECVDLYRQLESKLGKPRATPDEILSSVTGFKTAYVDRDQLTEPLVQRLSAIANKGNGTILLHGSEFTEWMHYAFPQECTNAELFGPAHWVTTEEWMENTGLTAEADVEDARGWIQEMEEAEKKVRHDPASKFVAPNLIAPSAWTEQEVKHMLQTMKSDDAKAIGQTMKEEKPCADEASQSSPQEDAAATQPSQQEWTAARVEELALHELLVAFARERINLKWLALFWVAASLQTAWMVQRIRWHQRRGASDKKQELEDPLDHQASILSSIV